MIGGVLLICMVLDDETEVTVGVVTLTRPASDLWGEIVEFGGVLPNVSDSASCFALGVLHSEGVI